MSVSPACGIFSRQVFDSWRELVEGTARRSATREELMWRRAIGPDLLLMYVGLKACPRDSLVASFSGSIVQFSSHANSITVGADRRVLDLGYWFAGVSALVDLDLDEGLSPGVRASLHAKLYVSGHILRRAFTRGGNHQLKDAAADIGEELAQLWQHAGDSASWWRLYFCLARAVMSGVQRRLRLKAQALVSSFNRKSVSSGPSFTLN